MSERRELIFGLLAALVSIFIVGGSFAISFAEKKPILSQAITSTPPPTNTDTPTAIILTPRPGEPTLTPSPTEPTSTPTTISPTPSCPIPNGWIVITIGHGVTLESLAETYQTSVETLIEANCLLITGLTPGSQFYVPELIASLTPTRTFTPRPTATSCSGHPSGWVTYIVQPGDTLYSLSQYYDVSITELQDANCMGTSIVLRAGSKIWVPNIPTRTPVLSPTFTPTEVVLPTLASTPTPLNTETPTNTLEPTATSTSTSTPTSTSTATPTDLPTSTDTSTPVPTATNTSTPIPNP